MSSNQSPFTLNNPSHFTPQTFGTARFIREDEVMNLRLIEHGTGKKLCPYVGTMVEYNNNINFNRFLFARRPTSHPRFQEPELPDGNGHLLTIAPTRAGKGTGHIIPNLLTWIGSVLVIDIKGENYLRTAGFREKLLKQKVLRFAPFEEVSEIWNPILSIRAIPDTDPQGNESTPEEEEDARYLTNLLITPSGSSEASFWENSAKNFLEGLLLYVRTVHLQPDNPDINDSGNQYQVHERSMHEVRRLLSLGKDDFDGLLDEMGKSKRTLIQQAGNNLKRLMTGHGKTGQSILAMALEQTAVWAYQRLHRVTYKPSATEDDLEPAPNDFSFSQMRDGDTSIYLIIPPDHLTEYRAILRVMIGFAMRELRQSFAQYKKDPKNHDNPPILFILDEFPQLAYMRPIEEALLYLAGYDVRLWFFVQDVSQLQLHYKNSWQTFFANTGTQCFFGVSDIETAKLVSERAGMTTIPQSTNTYGPFINYSNEQLYYRPKHDLQFYQPWLYSLENNATLSSISADGQLYYQSKHDSNFYPVPQNAWKSTTVSDASFPLITPDEVMRMFDDEQIIFIKGIRPIRCYRPNYYDFDVLKERSKEEPSHEIDFF